MSRVFMSGSAEKQLRFIPGHVIDKLYLWVERVEVYGIEEVRKIP